MKKMSDHLSTRDEEILALSSIYNELNLDPTDNLSGFLLIPVELDFEITLISTTNRESKVRFLPDIKFKFKIGEKYPELNPPEISVECPWLSMKKLLSIEDKLIKMLWGGEICLFNIIFEISERAKVVFGLEALEVSNDVFDEILRFAETEELKRFNETTYFCEICLEYKKGIHCFKLPRCGHISCKVTIPK